MNSKKAKKLRREARENTVGHPDAEYTRQRYSTEQVKLKPESTKGTYRALKRAQKAT